jgi:hypothetical protein
MLAWKPAVTSKGATMGQGEMKTYTFLNPKTGEPEEHRSTRPITWGVFHEVGQGLATTPGQPLYGKKPEDLFLRSTHSVHAVNGVPVEHFGPVTSPEAPAAQQPADDGSCEGQGRRALKPQLNRARRSGICPECGKTDVAISSGARVLKHRRPG